MRSRAKPSEPYPRLDHAYGDGALPDLTSGVMWTATALFGLVGLALPGTTHVHLASSLAVASFALVWGCVSFWLGLRGRTMSIHARAGFTAAVMPLVAFALWATGGSGSFIQPVLLLTVLFIAYFFPPRLAAPLSGLYVLCYATPLIYDERALSAGYPARVLMFGIAVTCATGAMAVLKRRLLRAEATQREMAERDPLTGVHNRRSFDRALAHALYDRRGQGSVALVVFDFNDFKLINDEHGHPVGDAVLSAVADACRDVVRDGDCLARIGGDEFALIAPGAGEEGVQRVVAGLDDVISGADMPAGVNQVRATFGWALSPDDAIDSNELFRMADARLIERKRGGRRPRGPIQIAHALPAAVS
jgi:diguanylate cyclase (GGDEF)-like protein